MKRISGPTRWSAAALLVLAGVTGCSGDDDASEALTDRDGADVVKTVAADMAKVNAMHVSGVSEEAGTTVTFDLSTDRVGHCVGEMSIGAGSSQFVTDGKQFFIKGNDAFWSSTTEDAGTAKKVLKFIGGNWALVEGAEFAEFCDLASMLEGIGEQPEDAELKVSDDVTVHRGDKVVKVVSTRKDGDVTTTLVTSKAPHRIVRSARTGSTTSTLELSDFDVPVRAVLPAEGDYVDLAKLTK
ncbi:hypothetical protein ACLM5J_03710 [Nocardioides sp. Bht2]|uniref:hypothetical protein n=1 Tax=Nocardioides sp. Bht2 TaxID=3392297 RepID=UPI0039B45DC4